MITVKDDIGVELNNEIEADSSMELFVNLGGINPDGIDGGVPDSDFPDPEDPLTAPIQLRRGDLADWVSEDPILRFGEFGFVADQKYLVLGDGVSSFNDLIADETNIYETKEYINNLVDNVYNTYDFVIATLLSDTSANTSDIALIKSSLPKLRETPTGLVNGSNTNYTTPHNYVANTLVVFHGGPLGRVQIDVTETGANTFQISPALEEGSLICQYIEQI